MAKAKQEPELDHARLIELMDRPFWLGKACKGAAPGVIRSVLGAKHTTAWHLFLSLAIDLDVDDATLITEWKRTLDVVLGLQADYAWGSKPKREKLRAAARDPRLLAAVQGAVAHADDARLDLLAVLVIDAGQESLDALVAHFDRALAAGDEQVDRLARLRTHACSTPALDALFAELEARLAARESASPALALGPVLGIGAVETLWFRVTFGSRETTPSDVPRIQGHVHLDSRDARWFSCSLSRLEPGYEFTTTTFSDRELYQDGLGLGTCAVAELPAYLARAAAKLKIAWDPRPSIRSSLRRKHRDRVGSWLFPRAAKAPPRNGQRRR